ncbi:thiol reductant ABC exporter subunit CydD [Lactococcus formosensis]|uniref:thiol reductant ABC exporter subunit CydD n=1 Tax=Lactococcus formosensis TaxID=1281486 RepID=UPI002435AF73|nr:thiol reductant ABC exporter subunit CydD [Lactococcus formosensis]MDG6126262.1 thiol reductant ABC exporter subunit CydD [Lactococcus formosensis]MDG6187553.1 thiol reductant ABC exporter subunit CydD [Lactococcus formosensis]MDG6189827.1 thiol reductant ABC exporter subunit CydD [Lactococcus formosensis]
MIDRTLFTLPGVRKILPALGGLALLQALCILGQALFLSQAITGLWQGQELMQVLIYIVGFFLSFFGREVVNFLRQYMLDKVSYRLAADMRGQILEKAFKLGPSVTREMGTGNLTSTVISGIDEVETYIKLVLSKVLNMMIIPILLLIAIAFLDLQTAIVLAIAFPFAIIFMILLGYAAQGQAERQYKSFQLLSNHFLDSLRGISTLKYFGLSKTYANSIYQTSERFRKATMATLRVAILSTFALDFFATLSVATVALFLGLRLMNGAILLFPALAALILAPEYFLPLRDFASDYHATLNGKNAYASVNEVLKTEDHLTNVLPEPIRWTEESQLKLHNLSKVFDTGRGVSDINLELQGYTKVAIVGESGSGKSTLLSMLSGFLMPSAGEIQLNEYQMTSLNDEKFRQSLQFIPQNTYIFAGTLRANLAFYQPEATDEAIINAAELAGLKNLLEEIGLDANIGAGGRTLSGGQMQRVALTRAFLSQERNILFLDEPTAHLDVETELEIKENILPLFEDKLVFLATHRLHWLPQMDLILVLNEGKLEAAGSHKELLTTNTYYQELLREMRG